mmetsp:Transcript_3381/g.6777  ORF Transcript_3381/g.6777 Transcript_3381/m.6777 type:complete len:90 (+) Transcript_3381:25-294(+)
MPWQSAPGFMIICGAFTLTGVGLSAVDRLETGRNRRVQTGQYELVLDNRDKAIKQMLAEKISDNAIKNATAGNAIKNATAGKDNIETAK